MFQLGDRGLLDPQRIDRLLLLIAIAVLASSLQGYALKTRHAISAKKPQGWRTAIPLCWRAGASSTASSLS